MTIRQRVMFALDDAPVGLSRLNAPAQWLLCKVLGHEPTRDQCGLPQHDFCPWCLKSLPDSWKPVGVSDDPA
jgi:hypothetical protein